MVLPGGLMQNGPPLLMMLAGFDPLPQSSLTEIGSDWVKG